MPKSKIKKTKMAVALGRTIRTGLRRLNGTVRLAHRGYIDDRGPVILCCAIGAALAIQKKTREEIVDFLKQVRGEGPGDYAGAAAHYLNRGLTKRDMLYMEAGYEQFGGIPIGLRSNPFYKLGIRLRMDERSGKL